MRWRSRRNPAPDAQTPPPAPGPGAGPDEGPSEAGDATRRHDEELPPNAAPLPPPPVRVVPSTDAAVPGGDHAGDADGAGDAGDDDAGEELFGGPDAPSHDGDQDWTEAAAQVRAEHAHPIGAPDPDPADAVEPTDAVEPPAPPTAGPVEADPAVPVDADPATPADDPPVVVPPDTRTPDTRTPDTRTPDTRTPNDAPVVATPAAPPPRQRPDGDGPLPGDVALSPSDVAAAARAVVRRALEEDLDVVGDVTAQATVPAGATGRARMLVRADGVVAGLECVALVYDHLDPRVKVVTTARDGDRVRTGDVVAVVSGPLRSVLSGERIALNLVTHLSGVATLTARYVDAVAGTGTVVRDTRKTTPGLRLLEKAAVQAGGGVNHRLGLSDALLVKDNHVAAAGGVAEATRAALEGARGRHVQVEVDSLEELELAVAAGARDVLLDNFDPEHTVQAVTRLRELERDHGRIAVECSGGLDLSTARAFAEAGADRLAVGALTHSAPQLDLALDLDGVGPPAGGTGT